MTYPPVYRGRNSGTELYEFDSCKSLGGKFEQLISNGALLA